MAADRTQMSAPKEGDPQTAHQHVNRLRRAADLCRSAYDVEVTWKSPGPKLRLRSTSSKRPWVTLTYAQSHDGKIAGANKRMLALSNEESMVMTHTLRIVHDAILVGIGTLLNDDPQLNARLLNPLPDGAYVPIDLLPRPVVLDGHLRTPIDCKLLKNARQGAGKAPLIVTSKVTDREKAEALRHGGAEIVEVQAQDDGRPSWPALLDALGTTCGIQSVMVEGGATVIESLSTAHEREPLIDALIVTVSPKLVGRDGLGYRTPAWLQGVLPSSDHSVSTEASLHAGNSVQKEGVTHIFGDDLIFRWSFSDPMTT